MRLSTPFPFDIARLLAPISDASPTGEFLRYDPIYDQIAEARREDDPALDQGVWQRPLRRADWKTVSQICVSALETRSKDLQIAIWLLEAWMHIYGFPGACEGLRALLGLCRNFWDEMYPPLDDPEYRFASLRWMNDRLSVQLKLIPVTDPNGAIEVPPCSWSDMEAARRQEQLSLLHPHQEISESKITIDLFQQSVLLTPVAFFQSLEHDVACTLDACRDLTQSLDEIYEAQGPSLSEFAGVLESILRWVQDVLQERAPAQAVYATMAASTGAAPALAPENIPVTVAGNPIRSRAEAYQRLAEAAEYLSRTEPHSPTPYLVRRAIAWGSMPLDEVLREVVDRRDALASIYQLLKMGDPSERD